MDDEDYVLEPEEEDDLDKPKPVKAPFAGAGNPTFQALLAQKNRRKRKPTEEEPGDP